MALALHVGGVALAVANLRGDDEAEGLGAAGAEYAVELASPKLPDNDLPPGPDSDATQASQATPQQEAEAKETDLPQAMPTTTEEADRLVTESSTKKPVEDETKVAAMPTEAAEYSPAQEASARKSLEDDAREAETVKAPNPGIGKDKLGLTASWGKKISAYFELHKRYPDDKNKATKVKLNLVINRRGNVIQVSVAESSGDPAFDDAAIAMVRRSDPVPVPPAELTEDQFVFNIDVNFNKPKNKNK